VIGVYYTFNIIMNAISLFGSVIILRLHFKQHANVTVSIIYLFNFQERSLRENIWCKVITHKNKNFLVLLV
jgi:hypothetical protein